MKKTIALFAILALTLPAPAEARSKKRIPNYAATGQIEVGGLVRQELFQGTPNWGIKLRFGRHFNRYLQWGVNVSNQYYAENAAQTHQFKPNQYPSDWG